MTRVEWSEALNATNWRAVWRVPGLCLWRRLQLAFLKLVALTAYYRGKAAALRRQSAPPMSPDPLRQATNEEGEDINGERARPFSKGVQLVRKPVVVAALSCRLLAGVGNRPNSSKNVAVVVPYFLSSPFQLALLVKLLSRLSLQSRPADFILLVEDGCPIKIPPLLDAARPQSLQLRILRAKSNSGPAAARNLGLRQARALGADIVCFLDADCEPEPDWVQKMEVAQEEQPGIVSGRTLAALGSTAVGVYHDVYGTLNGRLSDNGTCLYGCTCNLSIDTARVPLIFDEAFDTAAFEDIEFCVRARKLGIPLTYCQDAVVSHHYATGIAGFVRQFMRYGMAEPCMTSRHPDYLSSLRGSNDIPSKRVLHHKAA